MSLLLHPHLVQGFKLFRGIAGFNDGRLVPIALVDEPIASCRCCQHRDAMLSRHPCLPMPGHPSSQLQSQRLSNSNVPGSCVGSLPCQCSVLT